MDTWIEILLRSLGLFILSIILIRVLGKKHPSKMTPFSFVNYAVIAVIVSLLSVNIITNLAFGLIALAVWGLFPIIIDYLTLKSTWLHHWINGKETIVVKNGKVMEENLKQLRLDGDDLLMKLRSKNVFNVSDVEFAIMEPTGDLNVLLKSDKTPITPFDLGLKVSPKSESQTVILDGNILNESLSNMGLNQKWLKTQLEGMGISLDNVFLGQVDSYGDLYLDLFNDAIQMPQPKVKELIYANIQKAQADLTTFASETENKEAKRMYSNNAEKLKKLMDSLEAYLLR